MPNDLSAFKAEIWSKRIITNLDPILVMGPLVNRNFEGEITGRGSTVKVRTLGAITMGPYNGTINYQELEPDVTDFVVDHADHFAFNVSDPEQVQSDLATLDLYAARAAEGTLQTIEGEIMSVHVKAGTTIGATPSTPDTPITLTKDNIYATVLRVRTALSKNHVPMQGRWLVLDSETAALLLASPEFIKASNLGDATVQTGMLGTGGGLPGYLGRVAGFHVFESNSIPAYETDGEKFLLAGNRDAITYACAFTKIETIRRQEAFETSMRGLLIHKADVLGPESAKRLVRIRATHVL